MYKRQGLEDTQYQNLLDTHKTLMGWRHDFFNHLSVIGQMIQTGRGDEALGYIEALRNKTNESSTMVNSGNLAVDSILNAKLPAARENGIRVSLRLEVPKMKTDPCLLYTSDAADDLHCVALDGLRIIKKKKHRS